jgi:DNA repair exonuclease SbcCD ATPase subunit
VKSKIVEFQKIKVRNFLSYGDDPIEIVFQNGITFITGYNKDDDSHNGVGKTSLIVESLSFLLFGETYRDITQKLIKNKSGGKKQNCIVEGWLKVNNDEIHIVRGLSPNTLILSVNGDSDKFTKSIPETTKDIIDRIGVSKTVFTNTVVMTNKESMSFLNQKKEVKIKFVEGILGLEAFSEFLKLAKEEYKIVEENRAKKYQEVILTERDLETDKVYFSQFEDKKKAEIGRLQKEIDNLQNLQPIDNSSYIDTLQFDVDALEQSLPAKEDRIQRANKKINELDTDKKNKSSLMYKLNNKPVNCPSCKRPFEDHDHIEIENECKQLEGEVDALSSQIDKLNVALKKVDTEVKTAKNEIRRINNEINLLKEAQQKFKKGQFEIEFLKTQYDIKALADNPFDNKIQISTVRLNSSNADLNILVNQSKLAAIIKEAASPTGIKAILVKRSIDALNARINYYLLRLHSPFRVYFDEFFEESFKSIDGEEYCYGSLSGGEQKRVDFAMLFAFRDIRRLQSNVSINLTVMDELFDSALCGHGMQNIMDLLMESKDECFIIVTHKSQNVEVYNCEVIDLIKENGITRLNN